MRVADPLLEMQPGVLCHSLKNTQQQAVNDILAAYAQVDFKKIFKSLWLTVSCTQF